MWFFVVPVQTFVNIGDPRDNAKMGRLEVASFPQAWSCPVFKSICGEQDILEESSTEPAAIV